MINNKKILYLLAFMFLLSFIYTFFVNELLANSNSLGETFIILLPIYYCIPFCFLSCKKV
ncbi:Uncharacterised protein [Klebsiella pneumoniae]|nr:Uncharacterised protein [Klebsiella pneumoniae]SLY47498.1 Uncharacterised protein [Klebsiella pneumoniae]SLY48243.1 Uncharacterised protein [Klebsiella pneumoniae]SLY61494.1 Uncharacterised protein [Klebsiella pneumoniae]SLY61746.1 Uncharacterised protein [Klebsiella pneumoniae]